MIAARNRAAAAGPSLKSAGPVWGDVDPLDDLGAISITLPKSRRSPNESATRGTELVQGRESARLLMQFSFVPGLL